MSGPVLIQHLKEHLDALSGGKSPAVRLQNRAGPRPVLRRSPYPPDAPEVPGFQILMLPGPALPDAPALR